MASAAATSAAANIRGALAELSAPNNRPITDCLFQDASSFNKSHIVMILKSQWYDRRLVTLLL